MAKKTPSGTTDRDQQFLKRLSAIEQRVDSIDQTTAFSLRSESAKHLAEVDKIFRQGIRRAQVYLAANGQRSVEEIATLLGMKRQNVGVDLKVLREEQLLFIPAKDGNRDIWAKTPVDITLRVSKHLRDTKGLDADGRTTKKAKPTKHAKTTKRK